MKVYTKILNYKIELGEYSSIEEASLVTAIPIDDLFSEYVEVKNEIIMVDNEILDCT